MLSIGRKVEEFKRKEKQGLANMRTGKGTEKQTQKCGFYHATAKKEKPTNS